MKKTPLLHAELSGLIASLGHGDALVIADAGLPVPPGTRCIDLALTRGVPSFMEVLQAVLSEMQVERADCADELAQHNPAVSENLLRALPGVRVGTLPHTAFKARSAGARAIVRTGECSPYANVMLFSGVVF
jgi:D-ribose pyranase